MMEKVASFCNVRKEDVIPNLTASSLYAVPLMLEEAGLAHSACHHLGLEDREPDLTEWKNMVHMQENATKPLTIGLVGKYVALPDAYISVMESIRHAGAANGADVHIELINSEEVTPETSEKLLGKVDGIVVPGGFGDRGIEGKIEAVRYAREHKKPYLGLCLGMQMAVIEFARNVGGLEGASSSEFGQHKYDVSTSCPTRRALTWAVQCAWVCIPASLTKIPSPASFTARVLSMSVTVIVTSSTTPTVSSSLQRV